MSKDKIKVSFGVNDIPIFIDLIEKQEDEIERLNNIIKEAKEYIESYMPNYDFDKTNLIKLLEILNKGE